MFNTIGILSPGDMGHAVGGRLVENGLRVVAALGDRSQRTRRLAAQAGIEDVGDYAGLVTAADAILCILVPAQAEATAQRVANALTTTGASLLYADCNAIAPQTVQRISAVITGAGSRFADASIIGGPPRPGYTPRIYASGPGAAEFAALNDFGLEVVGMGERVGDASAIKMCYGALTKGQSALYTELLIAAEALGVSEALAAEFRHSQADALKRMEGLPGMPPKSRRWVGEMEEIAATFGAVGLTPKIFEGAADIYRFVGSTALADRNPEDPGKPSLAEMVEQLAAALK
jgi:3-hydroxyisobutyrate dehydrogenase-like beta-hydroxyacid dehydrogenase